MTQEYALNTNEIAQSLETSGIKRALVMMYGLAGYLVGMVTLLWFILAMGSLAPTAFSPLQTTSTIAAISINIGLIVLFALQHSIMARPGFKAMMRRVMPQATERATFLLFTGITLIFALVFWQPLPGMVWQVEQTGPMNGLYALYGLGWTYVLLATFVTNHFEFWGLRQSYFYFRNKPYQSVPFTNKFMYRYSRHPMMLGLLVGMWCVPVMSVSQFVMASLLTLYVFIGISFEEGDLMDEFGESYRKYRNEVAALIPKIY
jgi:protein-S-isoprenylcysteine O-methyltransferase Ste14